MRNTLANPSIASSAALAAVDDFRLEAGYGPAGGDRGPLCPYKARGTRSVSNGRRARLSRRRERVRDKATPYRHNQDACRDAGEPGLHRLCQGGRSVRRAPLATPLPLGPIPCP